MADNGLRRGVAVKVNRRVAVVSGRESRSVSKQSKGTMIARHREIRIERLPQSLENHSNSGGMKQATMRSSTGVLSGGASMKNQMSAIKRQKSPMQRMIVRDAVSVKKTPQGFTMQNVCGEKNMHNVAEDSLMRERRLTAQEIKQRAIEKVVDQTKVHFEKKTKSSNNKVHFGFKRLALAAVCAGLVVFAIVYFVNLNMPNVSLKVAAMQTGIEATYPAYVPRDYSLSDITSENGKVTLNFHNINTGDMFTIIEEKSSWDSNALASNYVQKEYNDNYTIVREQGLALYISGSDAAWVNGGICFKIKTTSGYLTKKQIKNIAASL